MLLAIGHAFGGVKLEIEHGIKTIPKSRAVTVHPSHLCVGAPRESKSGVNVVKLWSNSHHNPHPAKTRDRVVSGFCLWS